MTEERHREMHDLLIENLFKALVIHTPDGRPSFVHASKDEFADAFLLLEHLSSRVDHEEYIRRMTGHNEPQEADR